jgi:hypothetical protein
MDWNTLPGYDEKYSRHTVKERKSFGGKLVTVLYGAVDENGNPVMPSADAQDGHGEWYGIETEKGTRMFMWKHPASEGGAVEYGTDHKENALTDMEADLAKKKELCDEAKAIADGSDEDKDQKIQAVVEQYKAVENWDTPKDAEYEDYLNRIVGGYQKAAKAAAESAKKKAAIVSEAEGLVDSQDWKATQTKFGELMDEWKDAGNAGDQDDSLWEKFKAARDSFNTNRRNYFDHLDEQRAENKVKKEELIAKAKEAVASVTNFKNTTEVMNGLMDEWKKVKSAGHEVDEELWKQFSGARQEFFAKRKEFFAKRDAERKAVIDKKRALIEEAKEIGEKKDYSKEATDRMKQLDVEWREAGYSGKDTNDKLWAEFKAAKDVFWNGKHEDSQERFKEIIAKKQDLIDRKKEEINQMEEDVYAVDDFDEQRRLQRRADSDKQFVEKLKQDIEDLKKKIDD